MKPFRHVACPFPRPLFQSLGPKVAYIQFGIVFIFQNYHIFSKIADLYIVLVFSLNSVFPKLFRQNLAVRLKGWFKVWSTDELMPLMAPEMPSLV